MAPAPYVVVMVAAALRERCKKSEEGIGVLEAVQLNALCAAVGIGRTQSMTAVASPASCAFCLDIACIILV